MALSQLRHWLDFSKEGPPFIYDLGYSLRCREPPLIVAAGRGVKLDLGQGEEAWPLEGCELGNSL